MSSPMPPKPLAFEQADHLIVDAVGVVAERSFFAFVDSCHEPADDGDGREWYVANVYFNDGQVVDAVYASARDGSRRIVL